MDKEVIASTGDIKKDYEIIGLVSTYFNTYIQKKPEKVVDIFAYLIEELKEKATEMDGDGIVFIKVDSEMFDSGYSVVGTTYLAYGTVVKFLQNN